MTVQRRLRGFLDCRPKGAAFTLVEMLVAMAITLVMMAAVVTLFANVTSSVSRRRATMEMSNQIRGVRNVLQQDLQGATCPGVTWQRPESNHGYIELVEGPYREGNASRLIDGDPTVTSGNVTWPPSVTNPEIDHATSILPSSNLPFKNASWATDGGGLGDYDDILMLTTRNETKPFVGRAPDPQTVRRHARRAEAFPGWGSQNVESPLAEVVWFSLENPGYTTADLSDDPRAGGFFGEPGMRTIYRRTLLIAPWLNPYRFTSPNGDINDTFQDDSGGNFKAEPGLLRVLTAGTEVDGAIAALIAFQDRYDISARLEWDYNVPNGGRWKIMANTLGDLTKRENRFGHFGYKLAGNSRSRIFPYPLESVGRDYSGNQADVTFVTDPEVGGPGTKAKADANVVGGSVVSYSIKDPGRQYPVRPFAFVDKDSGMPATAQAMLNDDGAVVRVMHGPVPLWGTRRGEDVMLTNVLAFDVRVFDPGAPIFRQLPTDTMLTPTDPGWLYAYMSSDNSAGVSISSIGRNNQASDVVYPYVGQGAYVDLGYGYDLRFNPPGLPAPNYSANFASSAAPWFFTARALSDVFGAQLAPGFAVYDTWSFHYENDGVNEDNDGVLNGAHQIPVSTGVPSIDEGTNGLDDYGHYYNRTTDKVDTDIRLGVDDVGERETVPPYDKPLRGVQVLMRTYEPDSRAIRQVKVNQHFMQE